MYLVDKKKLTLTYSIDNEKCQYTKIDRIAFFKEENTGAYLSRACVDALLKPVGQAGETVENDCKIT